MSESAVALTRSRRGRALLASQGLDTLGYGVSTVALPWLVLESGGHASFAGLVWAVDALPYLAVGLVAGALADRLPSGAQMATAHTTQACLATIIPIWAFIQPVPLFVLLGATFMVGTTRVFADAGAIGAVAGLVGAGRSVEGQATLMASWSLGILIGPAIAGVVIALAGPPTALALEASFYAAAGLAALRVGRVTSELGVRQPLSAGIREGVAVMRGHRGIYRLTLLGAMRAGLTAGLMALVVPLLRQVDGLSSSAVGLTLSGAALVALLSTRAVAPLAGQIGGIGLIAATLAVTGFAALAMGVFVIGAVAVIGVMAVYGGQFMTTSTLVGERQRRAPMPLQARVGMAAKTVEKVGGAGGAMGASSLVAVCGLRLTYGILGAGVLALCCATALALRHARRTTFGLARRP